MPYTIKSTEQTADSCATTETKAMLYLMNFHKDSDQIFYFVVDFFNDLTGIDKLGEQAWDIQAKANKEIPGKEVGRFLVTLYKNYQSDFESNFSHYILFVGSFASTILQNPSLESFDIANFTDKARESIYEGLLEACKAKTYIDKTKMSEEELKTFLSKVTFVPAHKGKAIYMRSIVRVKNSIIINDEYLNSIFDDIKKYQAGKKYSNKENITINIMREFEKHSRHLTSDEIKRLVLSRVLHRSEILRDIPPSFTCVLSDKPEHEKKQYFLDCKDEIFRMLCDKAQSAFYWDLFEEIHTVVTNNPDKTVIELYALLDKEKCKKTHHLTFPSVMLFIALVKEGIEYDN